MSKYAYGREIIFLNQNAMESVGVPLSYQGIRRSQSLWSHMRKINTTLTKHHNTTHASGINSNQSNPANYTHALL